MNAAIHVTAAILLLIRPLKLHRVLKYGGVFSEEFFCAHFARRPVPRIIHHPLTHKVLLLVPGILVWRKFSGVSLDKVICTLTVEHATTEPISTRHVLWNNHAFSNQVYTRCSSR